MSAPSGALIDVFRCSYPGASRVASDPFATDDDTGGALGDTLKRQARSVRRRTRPCVSACGSGQPGQVDVGGRGVISTLRAVSGSLQCEHTMVGMVRCSQVRCVTMWGGPSPSSV
jgi:hypothetical protein